MVTDVEILTADEAWVALALLQRRHPSRESFSAKEILESAKKEKAHPEVRVGLQAHIYLHNVANVPPNSGRYRMFYKVDGGYRLFRPGDEANPARKGKITPRKEELPEHYHYLLDWYENEYVRPARASTDEDDPVLQMWGVGKEIWAPEGGDAFIARERAEWDQEVEESEDSSKPADLNERVWKRIVEHQGAEFHTARKLPFKYSVEGNGIWFYRNGKRVEQRLSRGEVNEGVALCPVTKTTELADLRDYAYLFGLLTDRRIRGADW